VPVKIVVEPDVIVTSSFEQKSVAVPLTAPLADWVQAPGVRVNVFAGEVPLFLIVIEVVTGVPGTMAVLPPNLLMVLQVPLFVAVTVPAADDRHTVEPG